jgi:hypothetical protein
MNLRVMSWRWSPASYRGVPGLVPGQSVRRVLWTVLQWGRSLSEYLCLALSVSLIFALSIYKDERGMAGHLQNAVFFRKMRALDRKILPRVASEGCEFRTVTWLRWLNEEFMARCM